MEIGVSIFSGIDIEKQVELFKKYGVKYTFTVSEREDFDEVMECFNKNGIICETLHAPFRNMNDMWKPGENGKGMFDRLVDAIDKCHKYSIPVVVMHVSYGGQKPEITELGLERFDELIRYAAEKNVKIAFENIRHMDYIEFMMNRYPEAGFCWDNGHESFHTPDESFMSAFGNRLLALHIHDNSLEKDNHVLPFDGKIDFEQDAKEIAESGYNGSIMLEVTKLAIYNDEPVYEKLTDEEYVERAVTAARRLSDMVEKYRK